MRYLREQGAGVKVGFHTVPLVAGAVIFDLNAPELRYPDAVMGYKACAAAVPLRDGEGRYAAAERFSGAGRGATVGKIAGPERCQRGGVGLAVVKAGGAEIAALTVVNALGDVFDCETGKIVAGARAENGFWDANKWILSGQFTNAPEAGRNTTIGAIVTDANLTKAQCNRLAEVAHDGLALAIRPVHTGMDGDALFVLSAGEKEADFNALCVAAVEAVRLSILNAVRA
jgi:L-aminopeptidase/D-esterase-like protein